MKIVSGKDFIIGALVAIMFMMLLGAGSSDSGRFTLSASNSDKFSTVCVTDTVTSDTRCWQDSRYWNDRKFSFTPKW